jgi:6-pyruvoyltetrahydropterin/6-carboxytetrahydropterin synthase
MYRLGRQVRFAVNALPDEQLRSPPNNSFGGYPALTGLGHYFALDVCVVGQLNGMTSYLVNIKEIDDAVRTRVIPVVMRRISEGRFGGGAMIAREVFDLLRTAWRSVDVESITFRLTPFLSLAVREKEQPMVRLSQKFEFSASHRLHNPALSDAENRDHFGKCNNPNGHGHNYELEVTVIGEPDSSGVIMSIPGFERIVDETVIRMFDHKNLNIEVAEFATVMPSVENIAKVIFGMLKPRLSSERGKLAKVTVWETPKTWCEYSE